MTIDEILAALAAIIDGAGDRTLTDDEVERYESLEVQLAAAHRSDEVLRRQAAYMAPAQGARVQTAVGHADDELDRAFEAYVRTGIVNQDIAELRAQEAGVPSEGGYLVPDGFRQRLVERLRAFGGLSTAVEEFTTDSGSPLEWPTVDDTANKGEIVDEEATFAAGVDLTFGTATLGAYKYASGGAGNLPLKVSVELAQDSAFDIEGFLAKALSTRIARKQSDHWVVGTGTGQPLGITHGKTGVEIAADTAGITYADLVRFKHRVDPEYRNMPGCAWAFNDATAGLIEGLVDANGRPLLREANDSIASGQDVPTLLGYPVYIDQSFPDITVANNTINWGVFGNLREAYVIRRIKEVQLVVLRELYAQHGQIGYMAWSRADGTVQNANAYIAMTGEQ